MDRVIKTPCWIRGGRIEDIVWIGKDVLAWCIGLYIVFFHVVEKRQTLRWCWNHTTGDGAHCITGHASLPIFAFSERSLNPRIFVFAYPSMAKICDFVEGCNNGYLAVAFTAHDYLVSLGSYPDFPLIVWCWRTGEKITTVATPMRDEVGQTIRITPIGRTVIGQMGKTCGRLLTWDLDVVGAIIILKDHEVKLPKEATIRGIDWCPVPNEPLLAITDADGHIYLSNYDGTNVRRIVVSQRCGICLDIEMPAICWFRDGIILRTTFCQIRYFKKDLKTDVWRKRWYVKSIYKPYILVAHPFRNDWLFYYILEGYLMQMVISENENVTPNVQPYLHYGGKYHFVDFLYPWCRHLVVTDDLNETTILESYSGGEISKVELDMEGVVSAQASHPDDPLIVILSDQGETIILGVTDPERPIKLARFCLQRKPLDLVRFSRSGKSLIAAHKETGNCYCISLQRDKPWNVIARLRTRRRISDVVLYDDGVDEKAGGILKIFVLCVEYKRFSAGRYLLAYNISSDHSSIDEVRNVATVMLPELFREVCYAPGNDPRSLIGSPYQERRLYAMKLRGYEDATSTKVAITGHHVRLARVFTDRRWIVTCAYDGLIIIRDERIGEIAAVVPAHHRLDFGSRKAIVSRNGDTVVALGHDGSLIAVRAGEKESETSSSAIENAYPVDREWYERQKEGILADYASLDPAIRVSLTRDIVEFPAAGENETWEEWQQETRLREEAKLYAAEKTAIMTDLTSLKVTLKELLDANETCPEIEKLPIAVFDLDRIDRDQKLKAAKDEREDVRMELEHLCASMDRVAGWIKTTFWDPQVVLGRSIFSFHGDKEVTNYPLLEKDPYFKDHLRWAQFTRDSVRDLIDDETFQPWHPYTDDELQKQLSKSIRMSREHERRRMDVLLEEEEHEIDPEEIAEQRAVDGMTTHRFVEQSPHYYSQMESYGFAHVTLDDRYLTHDCGQLRAYFNELFDDMYAMKEREMNAMRERNERIRYIDSELKMMFDQSVPWIPFDPQWHPKERAESIIQVLDHEVKAKPYVSPSQQDILDRQASEIERIRRLLLVDDFRDLALMRMMDGVLEVRWEDAIKVEVRKPACMLEKQPEQYTPDDIVAVRRYEADVEVLHQERERYKRMLEADYAKISAQQQEGVGKFDAKLDEFFQVKLRIEAAINQLKLRHVRGRLRNLTRTEGVREDDRIKHEISKKHEYRGVLEEHVRKLHDVYQEMLAQYEAICARDRALAKKFNHEFSSLSKANRGLLERQYNRRPKVPLKNVTASDLIIFAQSLVTGTRPSYLTNECTDYSNILDSLDARPNGLPQLIDAHHWDHLIRSRRQKIEIELRIRERQLEIAAVEQTISVFEGKIDVCNLNVDALRNKLRKMREERMTREQNAELQLVLKMGQVEIELRGKRQDAVDAVLVPRGEIVRVNEHILAAGLRKLDALKRMIDFRHGTSSMEWQHRCLRTRFEELKEDLRFLRDVMVTREMRMYLKKKAKGFRDDKTAVRLERETEIAKMSLERALSKETGKLENVQKKIAAVRKKNAELDRTITEMNVVRWEMIYQHDLLREPKQREHVDRKMRLFKQRSELIRKLQNNYVELLALQTEHELLRIRRCPTLQYFETFDDKIGV